MDESTGWLIDLYPDETGIALWLLSDDGARLPLRMDFPVTFFAAGRPGRLREAWRFLQEQGLALARGSRRDLFTGQRDVLEATLARPADLPALFAAFSRQFPELDLYDADIPLPLRFAARTGVGLLGRCRVATSGNRVTAIDALESPWELEPLPLPLRILELSPDVDPALRPPRQLRVKYARADYNLSLEPARAFEIALSALLRQYDPDLILTDYGDDWLFPRLKLNPNRDPAQGVLTRRANSYFAYGQVVYRGAQTHLYGRWHIDRRNAMLFNEYGLEGVLEQARVTGLGVQDMARKSPGAGITAMQMLTALRLGVLVPVVKQQAEAPKTLDELIRADKGGMIYQPLVGLHPDVAQIDFASMYPSIIVNFNISPEVSRGPGDVLSSSKRDARPPYRDPGLIPQTLRPLLEKRLALKKLLTALHPRDYRAKTLKARSTALKWLLVVCFGYLGYKNARFGKIESHEAVTGLSRELLLQAKETAEDLGFLVLHMYVDCLFVQHPGCSRPADFTPLMDAIYARTGIPIALDGVYRWVAFLPSRLDARIPVPNRYFGVFQDGEIKYCGIELRRHDTPPWVGRIQLAILECLAQAPTLEQARAYLPKAIQMIAAAKHDLKTGRIPPEELMVTQRLNRAVQDYKALSPAARAARQLLEQGQSLSPGQTIRFIHTRGKPGVWAYGAGELDPRIMDTARYSTLLDRAAATILELFEQPENSASSFLLLKLDPSPSISGSTNVA
ncbi:MAG TPA: DNA polymerase domain-containing protein [Anaerolineales bacterium]|jgi:DNA polymerase-2